MLRASQLRTNSAYTSVTKFVKSTHFMDRSFNLLNYSVMFCVYFNDAKLLPEGDREKDRSM